MIDGFEDWEEEDLGPPRKRPKPSTRPCFVCNKPTTRKEAPVCYDRTCEAAVRLLIRQWMYWKDNLKSPELRDAIVDNWKQALRELRR